MTINRGRPCSDSATEEAGPVASAPPCILTGSLAPRQETAQVPASVGSRLGRESQSGPSQ